MKGSALITRQDIVYAYRLILGREPESEAVVEAWLSGNLALGDLRAEFLGSEEFAIAHGPPAPFLGHGPRRVDTAVTEAQLAQMVGHVERTWEALGREDPHWSVVTEDRFRAGAIGDNEEAFYASGAASLARMEAAVARAHVRLDQAHRCLELGCGVGRVSVHLARRFSEVIACDISAPHIALARQAAAKPGAGEITFVKLTTLAEIDALPKFDVFFSVLTLQHNPPPVIAHLLRSILTRLAPGGIGYFQVPTYRADYQFVAEDYLANLAEGPVMEMHVLPQDALFAVIEDAGCRLLEIREDDGAGTPLMVSHAVLVAKR